MQVATADLGVQRAHFKLGVTQRRIRIKGSTATRQPAHPGAYTASGRRRSPCNLEKPSGGASIAWIRAAKLTLTMHGANQAGSEVASVA